MPNKIMLCYVMLWKHVLTAVLLSRIALSLVNTLSVLLDSVESADLSRLLPATFFEFSTWPPSASETGSPGTEKKVTSQ